MKYIYHFFGDDVPKEIEREYNRMRRYEQYLIEQEKSHGVDYLGDDVLEQIAEPMNNEQTAEEMLMSARLDYLPVALELLRIDHPMEYNLIYDYYLGKDKMTMMYLAEKYKITSSAVEYRLNKAKSLLKEYITAHENDY